MTYKLNKNNLKLLYQLDLNCKQSNREISKKLNISKDAVGYRIKKLELDGVIRGYRAVINTGRLGFTVYRIFLNLINISEKKTNELIDYLVKKENVWWIAKTEGPWNFVLAVWSEHVGDFYNFYYTEITPYFNQYIKKSLICPIHKYLLFNRSYFLNTNKSKSFESIYGKKEYSFDKTDILILRLLSLNARTPLIEMSNNLGIDTTTIRHRIKKLEENKIIEGYRIDIDFSKLKKDFYSIGIILNNYSEFKEIKEYLHSIPETTSITEVVGDVDYRFDLEVDGSEKYFEIIKDLKNKFKSIRETEYYRVLENYKIIYFPDVILFD
jgi:DNA-binding Lrp family transcriptional regulator